MATAHTLASLAQRFGLALRGDGQVRVSGVGTLAAAGPDQLTFLANPRYRGELASTRAGAVVLRAAEVESAPCPALIASDPYVAFAKIAALFDPRVAPAPGIHGSADIAASARIDPSAHIGAFVSIGARSVIAAGAIIGPGCVIGEDCVVGAGSELVARVTLVMRVHLGHRVLIHPGAVLGADGFGLARDGGRWIKVPQRGGVVIGDDCEIGANTTIDRGALEDTVLEEDVRLDNQIQIAHNVRIGAHTAMAGCVGVAGSTKIGHNCLIAGAVGINGHIEICDNVVVHAAGVVLQSITQPGEYASGTLLQDHRSWRRNATRFKQLDEMARSVNALSKDPKR
ncbi:MAG: UDP-3-O-(3-hydroxymyristoyl)glucosamine N-acyltransferase [Proteobacteria bacterium]|nr:UDP-3-O-(3-hydroxymyristoyl)glucosamine N-acyltransferase [Pseudomonadota bacterium]MBS0465530.1 UDP-3-O-(3-hydroxymyristoyl)glucosamine N-acyltransferase [Pseudomonadota bacterium]